MNTLRIVLFVLIIMLVGVSAYLGYQYFTFTKTQNPPQNLTQTGTAGTNAPSGQTFEGTVSCLPIKPGDPYRDEDGCALGLKISDGKYYILIGDSVTPELLVEGNKLRVTGSIDPTDTSLHYDVAGFITVSNIVKLN